MRTRTRSSVIASGVAALALFTAACSGGGSGSDDSAAGGKDGGKGNAADAAFKERECLRKEGLDVKEPKPGESMAGIAIGGNLSKEKMQAAMKKCTGKSGGAAGGEIPQAEKDKMLKYAQCMRKNGYNMPDPEFEGGGMKAMPVPKGAEQKKMEKAAAACKDIVA
ncbi:hypothetical protein ACQB60_11950 [Actinomycetota bacterium Odt1-20B]